MKKLVILVSMFVSGCYLANGSPPSSNYWVKEGNKINYRDSKECYIKSRNKILNEVNEDRFNYLEEKYNKDPIDMIKNHKKEYSEYLIILNKISELNRECFYNLGYRFRAPLYWCLAQDVDNSRICLENMKYKN